MATTTVSLAAIRRLVVSTQAYAPRFRRAATEQVEAAIGRLGAVQLDSISAVDRAHRLTLTSRIGAYDETDLRGLLASGRVFEYWAHEACLLPIELWPHFRRTMDGEAHWRFHERALLDHGDLVEPVLERIRSEGPLGSRDFEGAGAKRTCGTGSPRNWSSRGSGIAACSRSPAASRSSAATTSWSASSRARSSTHACLTRTRR